MVLWSPPKWSLTVSGIKYRSLFTSLFSNQQSREIKTINISFDFIEAHYLEYSTYRGKKVVYHKISEAGGGKILLLLEASKMLSCFVVVVIVVVVIAFETEQIVNHKGFFKFRTLFEKNLFRKRRSHVESYMSSRRKQSLLWYVQIRKLECRNMKYLQVKWLL